MASTRFGAAASVNVVAEGFAGARDVAFTPTPGAHLGTFAEGRSFSTAGEEAWVVSAHNHSVSIVSAVGTADATTFSPVKPLLDAGQTWEIYEQANVIEGDVRVEALTFTIDGHAPDAGGVTTVAAGDKQNKK